jgi:hypothetical protein
LRKPYFASRAITEQFPKFVQQIIESIDVSNLIDLLDDFPVKDSVHPPETIRAAAKSRKDLINDFKKKYSTDRKLKDTLKIKRGGARTRKGFAWKDNEMKTFYKQVSELPTIDGKRMWKYAYDELTKKNFSGTLLTMMGLSRLATHSKNILSNRSSSSLLMTI